MKRCHSCISREMALMMLLLSPKQVVGVFPFLNQMEQFSTFTYDCLEQKCLILWSRIFLEMLAFVQYCAQNTRLKHQGRSYVQKSNLPKFLSKGTEDCFETHLSAKAGCVQMRD